MVNHLRKPPRKSQKPRKNEIQTAPQLAGLFFVRVKLKNPTKADPSEFCTGWVSLGDVIPG